MIYITENFDFIADWFIPATNKKYKKIIIDDIRNYNSEELSLYPVEYKGYIDSFIFIITPLSDNIFKEDITVKLDKGVKNLKSLFLKDIKFEIKSPVKLNKVLNNKRYLNLIIIYDKYTLVIPVRFLQTIREKFFNHKEKFDNILKILRNIKDKIYKDSIISFWNLKDFIDSLNDKDIQKLINSLFSNNMVEETMMAALIAGMNKKRSENRLYKNLSRNLKKEIDNILTNSYPDKRWIEEVKLLVKSGIEVLLLEGIIEFDSLKYITDIKEKIKEEKYRKIFKDKPFDIWLKEAYDKNIISELRNKSGRKLLVQSISAYTEEFLEYITKGLSKKAEKEYREDFLYVRNLIKQEEIFKSQIKVVEIIKDIYYEEESKKIKYFNDLIKDLKGDKLRVLINETGIIRFAQATMNVPKELKRHIYFSVDGTMRDLLIDLYTGKIRFKSSYGENTINLLKQKIIKHYLYLKDKEII